MRGTEFVMLGHCWTPFGMVLWGKEKWIPTPVSFCLIFGSREWKSKKVKARVLEVLLSWLIPCLLRTLFNNILFGIGGLRYSKLSSSNSGN